MAQPEYVPAAERDRVRVTERLPVPDGWFADRPGEVRQDGGQPSGLGFGSAGPDQGYALKLVRSLEPRVKLADGEHLADATAGCLGVALKRASIYGRAPIMADLELAFTVWGFLGDAPAGLVEKRKPLFEGVAEHQYETRRIADAVPEATLRLKPDEVTSRVASDWEALLQLGS
jgi:hypothetical protein